jgi:uncharacterized protein YndB with AHSA1/START domain
MAGAEPLVREIYIEAKPETVFEFFVDSTKITRWLADEATLDPRPGGQCHQVHPGGGEHTGKPFHMRGEFLEVEPPSRVVFTWGFTEPEVGVPPGSSTVEVTLTATDTGTMLRLVHNGLPPATVSDHASGWHIMLSRLTTAITTQSIRHEVWINADRASVFDAITSKQGLDSWWGPVVNVEAELGFTVEFDHGLGDLMRMRITDLVPNERLEWTCVSEFTDPRNPGSEWRGSRISFELRDGKRTGFGPIDQSLTGEHVTILSFEHAGWPDGSRWLAFCNYAWGLTLQGMAKYVTEQPE